MARDKQIITFEGKCKWANVPPRKAKGPHKDYITEQNKDDTTYSISVQCDREKFKKLKALKIPSMTSLQEDDETGETYLKVKSNKTKMTSKGLLEFRDIVVVDTYGKSLQENIGNGSKVQVAVELADNPRGGKLLRLLGVKVLELIPYEDKSVDDDVLSALGITAEEKSKDSKGDDDDIELENFSDLFN